ncbi:MAG: hypothetical protein H7Y31_04975 [Chitinophagaceae bacterium]|nr:hypothetical protein [Chitinophagaceae bacterium]
MRYIAFTLIIVALLSCNTKFKYVTDEKVKTFGASVAYDLDSSYQLYTRQVVTVKNSDSIRVPMNGSLSENNKLLEIEYLFVSERDKKVLVINNVANRWEKYYNSPDKISDLGISAPMIKADIWYFAQFRFGEMDQQGDLLFRNVSRDGRDHYWNISKFSDSIKLNSISVADSYGKNLRYIDSAFSLNVVFVKSEAWQVIFKQNAAKRMFPLTKKNTIPEFELAGQTIYYHPNSGSPVVVFRFTENIFKHFRNVSFNEKRLYAEPKR